MPNVGQELLNVPFGDMVLKLATAIAEGQYKLDQVSCEIAKFMGDPSVASISLPNPAGNDPNDTIETSLIGAGFQPTFYQFTDTIIEVKMAISMNKTTESKVSASAKAGWGPFAASVNASYTSKYSFNVEGSSLLRTKITPRPPNAFLEDLLNMWAEWQQLDMETKLKEAREALKEKKDEEEGD